MVTECITEGGSLNMVTRDIKKAGWIIVECVSSDWDVDRNVFILCKKGLGCVEHVETV